MANSYSSRPELVKHIGLIFSDFIFVQRFTPLANSYYEASESDDCEQNLTKLISTACVSSLLMFAVLTWHLGDRTHSGRQLGYVGVDYDARSPAFNSSSLDGSSTDRLRCRDTF
ncbi:hypothetical protein [Jatrophihabitans sp.]|jgi:hypothetical protein|uniref:hypothetical protein n=1 Tax=Jatrophihabitans sp. TaxID=1932789 RepID=UPI0038CD56C5